MADLNEAMELINGDWNNLEGEVIVYSKFKGNETEIIDEEEVEFEDGAIFAYYISKDPEEFRESRRRDKGLINGSRGNRRSRR